MGKFRLVYNKDRVAEAKKTLMALRLHKKLNRIPFVYTAIGAQVLYTPEERVMDPEKELENQIANMNFILHKSPDTDFIPCFSTMHFGQGLIPSMFGAKQVFDNYPLPFTEGRIMTNLEEDLPKLKKRINPDEDGWGPLLKKAVELFLESVQGEIPVGICDIQAPYGIATKLLGNEDLMIGMYDAPELVHELMGIVTDAIIDTIRSMEKWAGNPDLIAKNVAFPMPGCGLVIYDDYISVISPELHREFCHPYNMRLYNEFGNGHLHTCGPLFPNYIDAIQMHDPESIDMFFLRGTTKNQEDMLNLKKWAIENKVILRGSLITYKSHFLDKNQTIMPDEEFVRAMAENGGLLWAETGMAETGNEFLRLVKKFDK